MKKYLTFFAAAVFAFAACEEKAPEVDPGTGGGTSDLTELYITVDAKLQHEVNTGYAGVTVTLPKDQILEFFGLEDSKAFHDALGYISDNDDPKSKAQVNNTLIFGTCYKDDGEWEYLFTPSTSANYGHWFTKEGMMTVWGSEDAPQYFFTECQDWTLTESYYVEDPVTEYEKDGYSYDIVWDYTVGIEPGHYDGQVGDKFSATEFIFEQETQKTVYITWNIEIVDYVPRPIKAIETVKTEVTVEYNNSFVPIALQYDYASIASKLGVSDLFADCDMYPVFADGTYAKTADVRGWYHANGDPNGYGDDAIMCLEQAGEPVSYLNIFCMPYNPNKVDADGNPTPQTEADKCGTFVAKMAFVNANDEAVILEVTSTITAPQAWNGEIVKIYDLSYEFAHNNDWYGATIELNADEITAAIGVAPAAAKMLGSDKFAATDLYFANAEGVDLLNVYFYEGEFIAAPIALAEGEEVASRCGTATGTFYLVNENKGIQVNVTATITVPVAE